MDTIVDSRIDCNSLKALPQEMFERNSTPSPTKPGAQFVPDVIEHAQEKILSTSDINTLYTTSFIIAYLKATTLRSAILKVHH